MEAKAIQKKATKEEMVEKMGVYFERRGLTPLHGRVFAYLLIASPAHKDFFEIQEFLKASKSAVSNAIKFLSDAGMVTYITFSGDRRRYFKVDSIGWREKIKEEIMGISTMTGMLNNVIEFRNEDVDEKFVNEIREIRDFLDIVSITFTKLFAKSE